MQQILAFETTQPTWERHVAYSSKR